MSTISIKYNLVLVWQIKDMPQYQVTRCKKIFNVSNDKQIKRTVNGSSIGYWLGSKNFVLESKINSMCEKIEKVKLPF